MDDLAEEARKMLEGVTPGPWQVYGEPEVGLPASLFSGEIGETGFGPIEPLRGSDLHFVAWCREGVPALLARLEAAEAKLALTYDDLYADALADARSDAQDFESDLWREVRKYLTELNLDWRDYADDGILAEDAIQYVRDCMDEETRRAEAAEAKLARMEEALKALDFTLEQNGWHYASIAREGIRAALQGEG